MDINKSLRMAIDTGDVKLGCNQTSKAIEKGEVKLVILSSNCPSDTVTFAEGSKANVHKFKIQPVIKTYLTSFLDVFLF